MAHKITRQILSVFRISKPSLQFQTPISISSHAQSAYQTRYPLNEQNANLYINALKRKATLETCLKETVAIRLTKAKGWQQQNQQLAHAQREPQIVSGRCMFSSKATTEDGKEKKKKKKRRMLSTQEKPIWAGSGWDKCKPEDICKQFDVCNCEQVKDFRCNRDDFTYKDCKKQLAPYPSFSEACYEEPYAKPDECKCPWPLHKHPTFRPQKKHFHTAATLRGRQTGQQGEQDGAVSAKTDKIEERNNDERIEDVKEGKVISDPYKELNAALFENGNDTNNNKGMGRGKVTVLVPPQYVPDLMTQFMQTIQHLHRRNNVVGSAAENKAIIVARERVKVWRQKPVCVEKPRKPPRTKPRCVKVPFKQSIEYDIDEKKKIKQPNPLCPDRGMRCEKVKRTNFYDESDMSCEVLAPSKMCPTDLLDRKPYKKYRQAQERKRKKMIEKAERDAAKKDKGRGRKGAMSGNNASPVSALENAPAN